MFHKAFESLLDAVYPPRCGLCGFLNDSAICTECRQEFEQLEPHTQPLAGFSSVEWVGFPFRYTGRVGQAVRRLKYERVTRLADPLALEIHRFSYQVPLPQNCLFVPVPIHWRREFLRGFNQSDLLLAHLPEKLVNTRLLKRIRSTKQQVGLSKEARRENLRGAFRSEKLNGEAICLIDDVCTTGSTLHFCALALKEAGAGPVFALTLAGNPDPQDPMA